jgi:tetratricopeptide (TPR) repeat protein
MFISHRGRKVKRNYFHSSHKLTHSFLLILVASQLGSCSYLTSRDSLFGDNGKKDAKSQTVTKSQYDELLKKYEIILKQSRTDHANGETIPEVSRDLYKQKRPDDIVNELNKLEKSTPRGDGVDLAETVDVFSKKNAPEIKGLSSKVTTPDLDYDEMNIGSEITDFRRATTLMHQNKFDSALNEFKILEGSKLRQISVRAKFSIGELLFKQGEFDLAMQVYEEILQKDAFSGLVLKTLGRLIVCSSKLKLKKKEEQYYSVLHDFFEES